MTGGAGFIGSELVKQLVGAGHYVIAVDNLVNGRWQNVEGVLSGRCQLETADIRDEARIVGLLTGVDVIFHLACLGVRHSIYAPFENHDVNATATLKLLNLARLCDVSRFVYVSSSEVYGTARWAPMTEEHPTTPNTVYGASKLAGESYTRAYYETFGYPTVVIRPFNTYGPQCHHEGDSGEVMPRFMLRSLARRPVVIFGSGRQTRDFTYVGDTARGLVTVGLAEAAIGQTINIGSGREVTITDLAHRIARLTGLDRAEILYHDDRPGDVLRLCADSSKAKTLCGFETKVTLDEGLAQLHEWYMSLAESPEALLEREVVQNWQRDDLLPA